MAGPRRSTPVGGHPPSAGRTLRFWLWWLVIACALPAWIGIALTLAFSYDRESDMLEASSIATARALAQAIDGKLRSVETAMEVLTTSPWFAQGDFAPLHAQAQQILKDLPADAIVVRRADGSYAMHSNFPFGAPLPHSNAPEATRRVFETGRTVISDLFIGSATGQIIVAIEAPVRVNGEVAYALGVAISAAQLADILNRQEIPKDWVATVIDRSGTIAARTKDPAAFVGAKTPATLWREIETAPEGAVDVETPSGDVMLNAYSRSATSGWSVVIGIPKAELEGELRRSLWLAAGSASALLILALIFARFISQRISGSIESLRAPALALGSDRPSQVAPSKIVEINEIGRALETASQLLRQRLLDREQAFIEQHRMMSEKEAAEQANRARSDFLAMMSHEIRTPMNGVMALAELLAESRLDESQRAMVRTIREAGEDLIAIINDILNYSKIEAGQVALEQIPCAPRRLLESAGSLMGPKARAKGLEFSINVDESTPTWVMTDPTRLRQVLLNIVWNAIKFTDYGHVTIDLRAKGDGLRFEVRDSGVGITPEDLASLFKPFAQAEKSISRRFGGTGLGLSISLGLLTLMGGRIGVESKVGEGSLFWFELPAPTCGAPFELRPTEEPALRFWLAPDRAEGEARGAVILCVEDNVTNRNVLALVMKRLGLLFDMAPDGIAALKLLRERRYGLLLTDYHMPEMNGLELTRVIREEEMESGAPRMPILALTADAIEGTEDRCRAAGMDGYALKPVSLSELENWVARLLPVAMELRRPDPNAHLPEARLVGVRDLNITALVEMVGDDPETIRGILADFVASSSALMAELPAQLSGDRAAARRTAHSLKSAARYSGASVIADLAEAIETALAHDEFDAAVAANEQLAPAFDDLMIAIKALDRPI